ncbi:hypothetical protein [Aquibium oceanicum]|uniref:Uncharacterized protein n=1 Tax=Aquibium oceanicum TaxID=1670800 RepID=A0A1L3SLL9_9HYPH|nr:hypothetical protein [Aquibium oceanicum]APH70298.1 hypothetical protein BSQ44_02040 [Aquibium oceanicum]
MDWRREGDVLEQILALLVSFAGLADRAAGLPLCLQLPALVFLTQGEAVARSFVIGLPAGAPAAIAGSPAGDRAKRLAADFRVLARMLRSLLALARRRARFATVETRPLLLPRTPARSGRTVPAMPAPDTS